ncbi:hypothetical protein HN51_024753 [Arachis hypogaea]
MHVLHWLVTFCASLLVIVVLSSSGMARRLCCLSLATAILCFTVLGLSLLCSHSAKCKASDLNYVEDTARDVDVTVGILPPKLDKVTLLQVNFYGIIFFIFLLVNNES